MVQKSSSHKINELIQELGKIPPQAVELEEAILGSALLTGSIAYCYKTIKAEEFYRDIHKVIYQAIEELHNSKNPIDINSVSHILKENNNLDKIGGPFYLTQLTTKGVISEYTIDFYAKIIHQKFIAREIIRITTNVQEKAFDPSVDIADLVEFLQNEIHNIIKVNIFNIPKLLHYEQAFIKGMITNSDMFIEYKSIVPDGFFIDKVHQKLWNVMMLLSDNGTEISLFSVKDILAERSSDSSIQYVKQIIETDYQEETAFEYLYLYLKKHFERGQINKMYEYLAEYRFTREPEEIVRKIDFILDYIRTKDIKSVSLAQQIDSTYSEIVSQSKLGNLNLLKTGLKKLDEVAMLSTSDLFVLGGRRGTGKTRFALYLVYNMLVLNIDVAACIICMEETYDKITRVLISIITGLEDHQIQSKNYILTEDDKRNINHAKTLLKKLDVDIIAHPVSMKETKAIFSKFCDRRKNKKCILLLDNIMLLTDNTSEVKTDDMIARELVTIKQKTKGHLMVLHHFTKAQMDFANQESGYRPEEEHLKGSTRLVDVCDHIALMNKPNKYHNIMKEESIKPPIIIEGRKVPRRKILEKLLIVEFTKIRDGTEDEDLRIMRYFVEYGTMKIKEWKQ
jgi:replicative DNA helicase